MHLCYIDEAGCTGELTAANAPIQPLLAVGAIFVGGSDIRELTHSFLALKDRYFRPLMPAGKPFLDRMLVEIKGADLRRDVREGQRSARRRAIGFLDDVMDMLDRLHIGIVARVWIKPIGTPINGTALYTSSVQSICRYFQDYLTSLNGRGFVVADGRSKAANVNVAHSVFTQKFQQAGDSYNRVLEMPTFGNSDNHAGIQVTDLLCSALLFPIAALSYCLGHVHNVHVHAGYLELKQRYGPRLEQRQFRYQDATDRWSGGITVSDGIAHRNSVLMFR